MKFILIHRTGPHWESGRLPSPELIGNVGAMMRELAQQGRLLGGEGLRASSLGALVQAREGAVTVTPGPFKPAGGVPSGFAIYRAPSLEDAAALASRIALALGNGDVELRPLTEAWHIGIAPEPKQVDSIRFMALHKATPDESAPAPELASVVNAARDTGVLLAAEMLQPSAKGARLRRTGPRFSVTDGPFAESKELIAGYALIEVPTRQDALTWGDRYATVVEAEEVDVREVV